MLNFKKMHGLGNDFIIIDGRENPTMKPEQIALISDRHRGVGCDQFIVLETVQTAEADVFMRIYNSDGTQAQACGNATRCLASLIMASKGVESCVIETVAGLLHCSKANDNLITVDMGVPKTDWQDIPLAQECDTLHLPLEGDPVAVNIGNPHCVFFVDDVESMDIASIGPSFETDPLFPEKTNVEFVQVLNPGHLRMRVWERGVGITQACGSGACATIVAAIRRGLSERKATITLDGGDLILEWRESDDHVLMAGPVTHVFDGTLKTIS